MPFSTISTKGQITLPARMRKQLGIKAHDRVVVETSGNSILIEPAADFFELKGFLGTALPRAEERKRTQKAVAARVRGDKR